VNDWLPSIRVNNFSAAVDGLPSISSEESEKKTVTEWCAQFVKTHFPLHTLQNNCAANIFLIPTASSNGLFVKIHVQSADVSLRCCITLDGLFFFWVHLITF